MNFVSPMDKPTLTIAVPTYQRASYLQLLLDRLREECSQINPDLVEVLVCDNASTDATSDVVAASQAAGLKVRYIRHSHNLGSDHNIAHCFNQARGRYVIVMGDDDLLMDGVLPPLLDQLRNPDLGAILLRPFGYDKDYRFEAPRVPSSWQHYQNAEDFLLRAGPLITLISGCIVNKERMGNLDATQFCGSNLVQVHFVLRSAIAAKHWLSFEGYAVACKRNNSGGYSFFDVFVDRLLGIMESYSHKNFSPGFIKSYEDRLLRGFYPYYVFRDLLYQPQRLAEDREHLEARFSNRFWYRIAIRPMLIWPRAAGIFWGAGVVFLGRSLNGDLQRGLRFALAKFLYWIRRA